MILSHGIYCMFIIISRLNSGWSLGHFDIRSLGFACESEDK